jgi:hypothetical protein
VPKDAGSIPATSTTTRGGRMLVAVPLDRWTGPPAGPSRPISVTINRVADRNPRIARLIVTSAVDRHQLLSATPTASRCARGWSKKIVMIGTAVRLAWLHPT